MSSNLYIPQKIKVGFQERNDTYTGKLAYVTYAKEDGTTFKDKSWNGWSSDSITKLDFDNKPSKFVLNKGVQRNGYFGSGRSVIRIYDHRDFEFEITVDNLMAILMHSDVSKRDLEEECVFAWKGQTLVLLPVNSEEYQESLAYTKKQHQSVDIKSLIKGASYSHKKNNETYIYIGHEAWFETEYLDNGTRYNYNPNKKAIKKGKKHVFFDGTNFVVVNAPQLSECIDSNVVNDFSNLQERFFNSMNAGSIKSWNLIEKPVYENEETLDIKKMYLEVHPGKYLSLSVGVHEGKAYMHYTSGSYVSFEQTNQGLVFKTEYLYGHDSYLTNVVTKVQEKLKDKGFKLDERVDISVVIDTLKELNFKYLSVVVNEQPTDFKI